ncbi:MAG: chromate transporter [Bacteroidales bacterium]|nr:chromate transporter [Bacteroidales bacterium]
MIYWELFSTFFIIGMFTIGGGYAMLSLIQNQVVTNHQWIDLQGFTDIIAVSQMTPGPIGINSATYIGYTVIKNLGYSNFWCFMGSLTATFAVVLPSFLIVLWICKLYSKFKNNYTFHTLLSALKPAVVGLIGAAAILLITPENFIDWKSWLLFGLAFIVSMWGKVNPILVILFGGIAGYLLY